MTDGSGLERAPSASVVIPTYNRRELVVEAMEGVLAQTHADFELIVVDDGSTDGTPDALRERYRGDARVRVFEKANGGTASARNRGLEEARGLYTGFLDSDDLWEPTFLATQIAALERASADAVLCNATYLGGIHGGGSLFNDPWFIEPTSFESMLQGGWGLPSALLVRTDVARSLGFSLGYRYSEDTEFLLRLNAEGHRLVLNQERGTVYRSGLSDCKTTGTSFEHLHMGLRMLRPFREHRSARRRMRHFEYTLHRMAARELVRGGYWHEARPHLAACWRCRPLRPRAFLRWARSAFARPDADASCGPAALLATRVQAVLTGGDDPLATSRIR